jgi:choice-of-anchor A domain-containing protein
MRRVLSGVLWMTLLLMGVVPDVAKAGPLSNSQLFGQFNAIIFGNFTTSSEVGGRTVVGGSISGGGNYDFNPNNATASAFAALSVYGSITSGGTFNINGSGGVAVAGSSNAALNLNTAGPVYVGGANSGAISGATGSVTVVGANSNTVTASGASVYVGGNSSTLTVNGAATTIAVNGNNSGTIQVNANGSTLSLKGNNTGSVNLNNGTINYTGSLGSGNMNNDVKNQVGSLNLTPPASTLGSFSTIFVQPLIQLSSQLAALTANSTAALTNGSLTFTGHPNSAGVAIFNVSSSQFGGASTITLNLGGATSAIINVNVDNCANNVCAFNPTVNFNDTSYASVLLWNFANATNLNFTTAFGGSILAPYAALTESAPIDGTVVAASMSTSSEVHSYGYTGSFPGATAASEPATLALVGTGLVGLAVFGRRKR